MNLIPRTFNGIEIGQRPTDGYMDATAMCKATGREWSAYWRNKTTQEFVKELADSLQINMEYLLEQQTGRHGGTYVHPKLAIHLAQWCSPKFAVAVSDWVFDILTTGRATLAPIPVVPENHDPVLAMIETARTTYLKQIEMQKQLDEANRRLAETERKSDRALAEATAAHQTAGSNYGWYTILAWCNRIGRRVSYEESKRHGKAISVLMRTRGLQKQQTSDPRFGMVGLYPESILIEYFGFNPDAQAF